MKIAEPHAYIDPQTLRKAQMRMVEILEAIDGICQRHGLCYFIAYGTLLGAVRHQGFIPWDDDCDIFMPRADYELFSKLAITELPDTMFLQNEETEPNWKNKIVKVRLSNTKLVEFDESDDEAYNQGIFVDIFIGDYYPAFCMLPIRFINFLGKLRLKRKQYKKGSFKRTFYNLALVLPSGALGITRFLFVPLSRLWRKNEKLPYLGLEAKQCGVKTTHLTTAWFPAKRDIVFEGHYFSVPNDSDALLKRWYGDYMVLPAPEDRHTHAKKIEV